MQITKMAENQNRISLWQAFQHWKTARRYSETRMLQLMFDHAINGMMMTAANGGLLYYNKALVKLFGLQGSSLLGPAKKWLFAFTPLVKEPQRLRSFLEQILVLPVGETLDVFELANGRLVECHTVLVDDRKSGAVFRLWTFVDCTEQQRREQELSRLSMHDTLTKLYNRSFFEIALSQFWQQNQRALGLITFDVCNLEQINRMYGYTTGNELLRQAAVLLQKACHSDTLIARLGGDEFGILLTHPDQEPAEIVMERVQSELNAYNTQHPQLPITLSVGYAVARRPEEVDSLIARAEERRKHERCNPAEPLNQRLF